MLEIKSIKHSYDNLNVLNNIDASIDKGTVTGILGTNGAGKTTLMSIIQKLISPRSGSIFYCGNDINTFSKEWHQIIGTQLQKTSFISELNIREHIALYAGLHEVPISHHDIICYLKDYGLETVSFHFPYMLSGGEKQKLAILLSMLHKPQLLLLDEPTASLDPIAKHKIWSLIKTIKEQGTTILIASHDMSEVRKLCDKILFLKEGIIASALTKDSIDDVFIDTSNTVVSDIDDYYVATLSVN